MSTSTATFSAFAPAQEEAKELSRLNCIGYVGAVGEAKVSQSGVYIVQPLTVEPTQGGKKAFVNFLYRPEWLRPGFNPASLKAEENGATLFIVYKLNISCNNQVSALMGLAGSEENFNTLAGNIQAAIEGKEDSEVPAAVTSVLQEFFSEVNPEVGYVSVQKKEKTGNIVNGRAEKRAVTGQREIGGWFIPGAESQKRHAAEALKGTAVNAYELD